MALLYAVNFQTGKWHIKNQRVSLDDEQHRLASLLMSNRGMDPEFVREVIKRWAQAQLPDDMLWWYKEDERVIRVNKSAIKVGRLADVQYAQWRAK